ncbi:MAG: hypothetical protein PHC92_09245 [Syntrophomonadaceae bacterium]|nr:hypothetical protein [Syntrophomonadaceae bacterium]
MNMPQFKAGVNCLEYEQLLHYTSVDVLKIMLNNRTLKCNSLKNVNDRLECQRKGIENLTDASYVSCFDLKILHETLIMPLKVIGRLPGMVNIFILIQKNLLITDIVRWRVKQAEG